MAALNDYDNASYGEDKVKAMKEQVDLFYEVLIRKELFLSEIILLLNKNDLFRERLRNEIPLTVCFSEDAEWPIEDEWYHGINYFDDKTLSDQQLQQFFDRCYNEAINFIKQVLETRRQWASQKTPNDKVVVQHVISAVDTVAIRKVFDDVHNIVIHSNLKNLN